MINFFKKIKKGWQAYDKFNREKAAELHEKELVELQNIFALLVTGSLIGSPFSPIHIQLELLNDMQEDVEIMLERTQLANDPLAELFSVFDIG